MSQIFHLTIAILLALIFWAYLHLAAATSLVYSMLENGFLTFIDVASKIATVGTFIWAILTLSSQRKSSRELESEKIERKIVDLISAEDFRLRRSSARVLIYYIYSINSYSDTASFKNTKPIFEEYLAGLSIFDLLDIVGSIEKVDTSYAESIKIIKNSYEALGAHAKLDPRLVRTIAPDRNFSINPPMYCLDLWQVIDLLSFVLDQSQEEVETLLSHDPTGMSDPHHRFPALFAYHHFYGGTNNLWVREDGSFVVSDVLFDHSRKLGN